MSGILQAALGEASGSGTRYQEWIFSFSNIEEEKKKKNKVVVCFLPVWCCCRLLLRDGFAMALTHLLVFMLGQSEETNPVSKGLFWLYKCLEEKWCFEEQFELCWGSCPPISAGSPLGDVV